MIAARFKAVGSLAAVAAAALGCYLVSLQVAAERGQLLKTERRILAARADIRQLRTELDTRARLVQLERWNADVLGLQAPKASQYAGGEVHLADYVPPKAPPQVVPVAATVTAPAPAPVVAATFRAPTPAPAPVIRPAAAPVVTAVAFKAPAPRMAAAPVPAEPMVRHASFTRPVAAPPVQAHKAALLGDGLLGEIGRKAAAEAGDAGR